MQALNHPREAFPTVVPPITHGTVTTTGTVRGASNRFRRLCRNGQWKLWCLLVVCLWQAAMVSSQEEQPIEYFDPTTLMQQGNGQNLTISNNDTSTMDNRTGTVDPDDSRGTPPPEGSSAYEFVAFLAWYIFLLMCCVFPACCAFRRRRIMEQQMTDQQAQMQQMRHNQWYLWTTQSQQNSEAAIAVRRNVLMETLKPSTMVVTQQQLIDSVDLEEQSEIQVRLVESEGQPDSRTGDSNADEKSPTEGVSSESDAPAIPPITLPEHDENAYDHGLHYGYLDDTESNRTFLQLPGGRTVTSLCAICLSQYEPGESVSWSTHCPHVFHTDCIVSWLSKKQHCPVCRQEYCDILQRTAHEDDEEQQLQLARAFGGTVPMPLFAVEHDGRLMPVSYTGGDNRLPESPHVQASNRNANPGFSEHYDGPGGWTPWLSTRQSQHALRDSRLHMVSLSGPRLALAEARISATAASRQQSAEIGGNDDPEIGGGH